MDQRARHEGVDASNANAETNRRNIIGQENLLRLICNKIATGSTAIDTRPMVNAAGMKTRCLTHIVLFYGIESTVQIGHLQ